MKENNRNINLSKGLKVLSLFDGISCGRVALERAGIPIERYVAYEIDNNAIKISQKNYPDIEQMGDVTTADFTQYEGFDILIGGSPCQSFSFAGKMIGMVSKTKEDICTLERYLELKEQGFEFDGYSYLFWEYIRALKEVKPKYFLLENVKMSQKWKDIITETIGVEPILIDSALVYAQHRERNYWTNIPNVEQPKDKHILFKDVIKKERKWLPLLPWVYTYWGDRQKIDMLRTIDAEKSFCVTTNKTHSKNYYLNSDKTGLTKLDADETEILQTLPSGYTANAGVAEGNRFKAIGNGWTVDVIAHIFSYLRNL